MEYCGNGDLGGYVKKLKDSNTYAEEHFVWQVLSQLVSALYRCHYGEDPPAPGEEGRVKAGKTALYQTKEGHRMILHRDLKPENGKASLWFISCTGLSPFTDVYVRCSLSRREQFG